MTSIRTVTLQILRLGPPHNQLLSPLTQYTALSDGFEPTALHVPYEHRSFLRDLNVLRYKSRDVAVALGLIADQMSAIFGAVPGLIAGLARPSAGADTLTHLRLIFSAAELSLLPFELAKAPAGFPGEGKPLSLQLAGPVVMTREVRGAPGRSVPWPNVPRILFACASPPGFELVPARANLVALMGALAPWIGPPGSNPRRVPRYLHVLEDATYRKLRDACRDHEFTHVHLLAHGASHKVEGEQRFGIALMGEDGGADIVGARGLVSALRVDRGDCGHSSPAVVSLATCESANRAQALLPGGSIAHELHEAGIPLVVASQFPLTMKGSVVMTDALYTGLLRGDDPRCVLHRVRQQLAGFDEDIHDWASLVAYASFGEALSAGVESGRYTAARHALWTLSSEIDESAPEREAKLLKLADEAIARLPRGGAHELDALGNIGAKLKRDAHHFFKCNKPERSLQLLREARDHYRAASRAPFEGRGLDSTLDWTITQWLTLDFVMGEGVDMTAFFTALYLAESDARNKSGEVKAWAIGSLIDLELIRSQTLTLGAGGEDMVRKRVQEAREEFARFDMIRNSLDRQLDRWINWWGTDEFEKTLPKARDANVRAAAALAGKMSAELASS